MEARRRIADNRGMEENTMAILDCYGSRDSLHQNTDRFAFLDAVRSGSIVPEDGPPPTKKMFEAIFGIFRDTTTSLELMMTSYQLLLELEKRFPRVYQDAESDELIIVEEAWSPFSFATSSEKPTSKGRSNGPLSALEFHLLLEGLVPQLDRAKGALSRDVKTTQLDLLGNMLAFQYLVYVLERDFWPRNNVFLVTSNWTLMRESILNMLLGSRQIKYKTIVDKCLSIISISFPELAKEICSGGEGGFDTNEALMSALSEAGKSTQKAANKLLAMIMKLDTSRKIADMKGLMTRGDGVRSTMESILDGLMYENNIASFLLDFDEPKLKLEIILQYFRKYIAKPTTRTARPTDSIDDTTIFGVVKGFAKESISKNIIKKIGVEVLQILLAHTLQACLALPKKDLFEIVFDSKAEMPSSPLRELSSNIASAFKSIQSIDKSMEIIPIGKEALFAAAAILAT